jgi:uncharacterized damage-inducible protein DinB
MNMIQLLVKEMEQEATTSRKMLALVPADKFDWKPHEKSMNMKQLAVHVAEIPGWVDHIVKHDVLDFEAGDYTPAPVENTSDLLALFEKSYASGMDSLKSMTDNKLVNERWVMKSGAMVFLDLSKYEAIRHSFSQITHHRAQLGVYFRLLNIAVPKSYGPTADDTSF